jgi:dipeptidase D
MVATVFRLAGFEVEHSGSYPGWKPDPKSDIVLLQAVHEKMLGQPAKLIAMHAGLECGVIGEKYPGMQMASFGPTIVDRIVLTSARKFPRWRISGTTSRRYWSVCESVAPNRTRIQLSRHRGPGSHS